MSKLNKKELLEILYENFFTEETNTIDLSGLDFSVYDCSVDIGGMKVSRNLLQDSQEAVKLNQGNCKAKEIDQSNQKARTVLQDNYPFGGGKVQNATFSEL